MSGVRPAPGAAAFANTRLEWRRLLAETGADLAAQGAVIYPGEGHDRF
jgi:hypothetical protein